MYRANDALIQSASALLRATSDAYHRALPPEAIDTLDRQVEAVQRLVSRISAGVIDVLVVGKPSVGRSSLVGALAAALSAPRSMPQDSPPTLSAEGEVEVDGNRIVFTTVSDTALDDPLMDECVLAAFAVIVVLDSEPYAHEVKRFEQLIAAVPGVPIFVFVNKLDVLQYMHGADLSRVEARIREKVAPFVADARRDVVFGSATAIGGHPAWASQSIGNLVSAVLAPDDADSVLNERLTRRVRAFVLSVREEAARVQVTQHAILGARHRLRRAALVELATSVAAIMGVDDGAISMSSMVDAVHRRFGEGDPASHRWRDFADRLICAAPWSSTGIRRRRYSRLIRFGEIAIEMARAHAAAISSKK
jgi:hypothetical protein